MHNSKQTHYSQVRIGQLMACLLIATSTNLTVTTTVHVHCTCWAALASSPVFISISN